MVHALTALFCLCASTLDTDTYREAVSLSRELLGDALGDGYALDEDWVKKSNKSFTDRLHRLEAELNMRLKESVKDKIRVRNLFLDCFHSLSLSTSHFCFSCCFFFYF